MESTVFRKLHPILLPGESVLGSIGVPSFAADGSTDIVGPLDTSKARGLEGVLNQGPSLMVDNILTPEACEQVIDDCNRIGFGSYNSGKNYHGALQILVSQEMADTVAQRLSQHIDVQQVEALRKEMIVGSGGQLVEEDVRLVFTGLNRRWRIYRYDSNGFETFAPHIDAGFPPSGISEDGSTLLWDASSDENGDEIVSRLTVLMYLNDDFTGGETNFYGACSVHGDDLNLIASVRPVQGSCLLFPQGVGEEAVEYARKHWPLHEGSPVRSGRPKYVIRSDVLFATQREPLLLDDELFRNDHVVRQTFLPTSPTMNKKFLGHTMSLYNPHMGVENLGPLLYSFIRFTKKRKIVEIGAGYTSLWIVQALAENDVELERIRTLQQTDRCRLLNYPWSVPSVVQDYDREAASLLCIDNCEHQKETATGASAVAKSLGLDSYMQFMKGDAFELELEPNSVDVLWCDFGVGSRCVKFHLWSQLLVLRCAVILRWKFFLFSTNKECETLYHPLGIVFVLVDFCCVTRHLPMRILVPGWRQYEPVVAYKLPEYRLTNTLSSPCWNHTRAFKTACRYSKSEIPPAREPTKNQYIPRLPRSYSRHKEICTW
jgi:hypothetical protein